MPGTKLAISLADVLAITGSLRVDGNPCRLPPRGAHRASVRYWIVNLPDRVVEVYRQPGNGRYADIRRIGPGEILDAALLPGVALPLVDLFPAIV